MRTNTAAVRRTLGRAAVLLAALAVVRPGLAQLDPTNAPPPGVPVTEWPVRVDTPSGSLSVYQPQPEKFEGDQLTARAAVSLTPTGATDPQFGAVWFTAQVLTDRDARTVAIRNMNVRQVKLPGATPDQEKQFEGVLNQQVPAMHVTFGLDQLEATLGVVEKARTESQQLQTTPPRIVFTTTPTTLVTLDGEPKLQQGTAAGVMRVVNTPFILLFDLGGKRYYLKAGDRWVTATDVTAPWSDVTGPLPGGIADEGNRLVAEAQQQQQPAGTPPPTNPARPPQVMVAETPTEVVASDGQPQYTPLPGNDLLYMTNTSSDLFLEVTSQRYFVLLSGRWFTSPSLERGPWEYVGSDHLPAAFAAIPTTGTKAHVLASIAGTQQALDARTDAYIPQTTGIRRDAGASLAVTYDGTPQFVPVEGTNFTYATNCADPVVYVDNSYYCCHQAVWYRSDAAAGRPWGVCESVPAVIYTIPPSCPIYPCRYCYVYESTPDYVYCGYLPGYTGCYVYGPTVVYGTGYAYPYWYGRDFYARPYTYGFGPRFDLYTDTWGFGAPYAYGPGWFAGSRYRDGWFGSGGYVDYRSIRSYRNEDRAFDQRAGENFVGGNETRITNNVRNVTVNRINIYNRQDNVRRNVVVNNSRIENRGGGGGAVANVRPGERAANNVYVGHDGQVYRRTDQGWEHNDGKNWSAVSGTPEANRAEGGRAEGGRADVNRTDVNRTDVNRADVNRADVNRADGGRADGGRAEGNRGGERADGGRAGVEQGTAERGGVLRENNGTVAGGGTGGTAVRPGNNGTVRDPRRPARRRSRRGRPP